MGSDHARFAVFVLTHGRPDNVLTVESFRAAGYTGRIYLVIDDEDECGDEYRALYGDSVIVFSKDAVEETFDVADTQRDRRAVVYARNAVAGIARDLGLDYFLQLDDDYTSFRFRRFVVSTAPTIKILPGGMDGIVEAMLTFLDESGAATVAFSQGGDHLSGVYRELRLGLLRKAMNSFFVRTDRPVEFLGRINEDVNTYVVRGGRGDLFFTVMGVQLEQLRTQANPGGMTDIYLDGGTYVKSFYTVMMAPSCVRVTLLKSVHRRFHHEIRWDKAVPKILSPRHRKPVRA